MIQWLIYIEYYSCHNLLKFHEYQSQYVIKYTNFKKRSWCKHLIKKILDMFIIYEWIVY